MQFLASEINKHIGTLQQWQKATDGLKGKLLLKAETMIASEFGAINAFNSAHRKAIIMQAGYLLCADDGSFCNDVETAFAQKASEPVSIPVDTSELASLQMMIGSAKTLAQRIATKAAKVATKVDTNLADDSPEAQHRLAECLTGVVDRNNPLSILMAKVIENLENASDDIVMFLGDEEDEG